MKGKLMGKKSVEDFTKKEISLIDKIIKISISKDKLRGEFEIRKALK